MNKKRLKGKKGKDSETLAILKGMSEPLKDMDSIKKREEVLIRNEEKYREMAEIFPEMIFELDLKGKIIYANKAALEKSGYSKNDLDKRSDILKMVVPGDRVKITSSLRSLFGGKKIKRSSYEVLRKDGTTFPVFSNPGYILDDDGKIAGLRIVLMDISDFKKAELEIVNLSKFPSENPNPVIRIDRAGKIIYSNDAGKIQLSKLDSEVGGRAPDIFYNIITRLSRGKDKRAELLDVEIGDDTYEFVISCIKDSGYANLYGRDVTKRKKIEINLKRSYSKLEETLNETINIMASITEISDPYTSGHQKKVAELASVIALEMQLDDARIEVLTKAARIHDIGKINIPPSILAKPGKINNIEYSMIRTHSQTGHDLLKEVEALRPMADIILQHHERLDGSGYPKGLRANEISLEAKILVVADVVEAMSSHRPYRPALGVDEALKEITRGKGTLYDPEVVDACHEVVCEKKLFQANDISDFPHPLS